MTLSGIGSAGPSLRAASRPSSTAQSFGRGRGSGAVAGNCSGGSESADMLRSTGANTSEFSGAKACADRGSASDFPACGAGCSFTAAAGTASALAATTRRTGSAGSAAGAGALGRTAGGANCAVLDLSGANSSG